jgi:tyrosyl-tRNA synthetase
MNDINELLTRGVANIIPNKELLEKVLSGKKLNIYLGIDPTATKIHLGHAVPLRKLQKFAELGHSVTFLIGDFTALIGDTSDKDTERPVLTKEEIEENFATYKEQAEKVLDFSKIKVVHNSEWLSLLTFEEIIKLTQHFSFGDFTSRELIKKRLSEGKKVGLHEALYPVMQGYDSYFLDTDLQIGGADQTFNMQAGRTLQKALRNKESFVLSTEYLTGTDGRKMSKSWGNAIWLSDEPSQMYGKVMSIKDDLIIEYFTLATSVSLEEIKQFEQKIKEGSNPIEIKKKLANQIVSELYSNEDAEKAQNSFQSTVQNKEMPEDIPIVNLDANKHLPISDLLVELGLSSSKSEAKRLVEQGGVFVNEELIATPNQEIIPIDNMIIKAGKRNFIRIKLVV